VLILYMFIFYQFGMLYQKESGSPGSEQNYSFNFSWYSLEECTYQE
jgi:hypothetical protein